MQGTNKAVISGAITPHSNMAVVCFVHQINPSAHHLISSKEYKDLDCLSLIMSSHPELVCLAVTTPMCPHTAFCAKAICCSTCNRRPQRGQGKAHSLAVQERQRAFQSLEASLSSQLDPIDWATYEPYLWANEATYYQRAATLFGALLQTQRLHSQVIPHNITLYCALRASCPCASTAALLAKFVQL